jgi:pimeloyl-ACP methyl ester carboxylesterase
MNEPSPLILLPGMGADDRMFVDQRLAFPQLRVPAWIEPRTGEPLPNYAQRLAEAIDPGEPYFVGGASFGGMVALEMAPFLPTRAVFLIGSARSPSGIRGLRRWRGLVAELARWLDFRLIRNAVNLAVRAGGRLLDNRIRRTLRQLADADAAFLRWATRAVLEWEPTNRWRGPIFQVHGERDWPLPAQRSGADLVIPYAGHLLSVTHAAAVNRFLREQMDSVVRSSAIHSR